MIVGRLIDFGHKNFDHSGKRILSILVRAKSYKMFGNMSLEVLLNLSNLDYRMMAFVNIDVPICVCFVNVTSG